MEFKEKLRRLTEDRHKVRIAARAGLHPTSISTYINRGYTPRADIALRIARALDVSFEWLFDDSQEWPPVWDHHRDSNRTAGVA